ncbi:anaerobic ribonucleoside-triphosphate reductase, partial [Bacillus licheniformis]|uniref:anaerobic ribonucleoside-triphosphate reductase n=1 Tax=Bacillus licheniformis TaxID=1402 RepID=UPI0021B4AADA
MFPIHIFKIKKPLNLHQTHPNYHFYPLPFQTTPQTLFPNFTFIHSPLNKPFYHPTPQTEIAY